MMLIVTVIHVKIFRIHLVHQFMFRCVKSNLCDILKIRLVDGQIPYVRWLPSGKQT
jgi:hypothetical protein